MSGFKRTALVCVPLAGALGFIGDAWSGMGGARVRSMPASVAAAAPAVSAVEVRLVRADAAARVVTASGTLLGFGGGESWDQGLMIVLSGTALSSGDVRVEQSFENTLALEDEGPRHELQGERRYVSPFLTLERAGDLKFRPLPVAMPSGGGHPESLKGPPLREAQTYKAFLRSGGARWANLLAAAYRAPDDPQGPPYAGAVPRAPRVVTALVRIRVSVRRGGRWREALSFSVSNPHGRS